MDIRKKYKIDVNMNPNDFGGAFGLPPKSYISQDMQKLAFPVIEITPAIPSASSNLDVFVLDPLKGGTKYIERLGAYGVTLGCSTNDIPFAYLPDATISDSLTNDYGETFLQKASDVTGEGFGEMSQMFGGQSINEMQTNMQKFLEPFKQDLEKGGIVSNFAGKMAGGMQAGLQGVGDIAQSSAMQNSKFGQVLEKLATGHRFDFPMIWRNSTFAQNYSVTIRLYNPNPSNRRCHRKYILGPLAMLMVLALPSSDKAFGFTWPFFVQIRSAGFFNLPAAGITGMSISKGGDSNQVAWVGPRVSTIDVRIEFVSLYGTLVDDGLAPDASLAQDKPNLAMYLASLDNETSYNSKRGMQRASTDGVNPEESMLMASINQRASNQAVTGGEEGAYASAGPTTTINDVQNTVNKAGGKATTKDITFQADSRIPLDKSTLTNTLKDQQPVFYEDGLA